MNYTKITTLALCFTLFSNLEAAQPQVAQWKAELLALSLTKDNVLAKALRFSYDWLNVDREAHAPAANTLSEVLPHLQQFAGSTETFPGAPTGEDTTLGLFVTKFTSFTTDLQKTMPLLNPDATLELNQDAVLEDLETGFALLGWINKILNHQAVKARRAELEQLIAEAERHQK